MSGLACGFAGVVLLALSACGGAGAGAGSPAPRPAGYQGVIVWLQPAPDTVPVAFRPEWRRAAAGADTVWAFAQAAMGDRMAYGRMEGDSLVWGLGGIAGDAGTSVEFAGVPETDGTVRGCLRAPRRGWGPSVAPARAAFVLRPADLPGPGPGEAPVNRC